MINMVERVLVLDAKVHIETGIAPMVDEIIEHIKSRMAPHITFCEVSHQLLRFSK